MFERGDVVKVLLKCCGPYYGENIFEEPLIGKVHYISSFGDIEVKFTDTAPCVRSFNGCKHSCKSYIIEDVVEADEIYEASEREKFLYLVYGSKALFCNKDEE